MKCHRAGFTLIEVMVALAIVAITLAAGLRAAGALTDNAERLSMVLQAQWCAENRMALLRIQSGMPDIGESDFPCEGSSHAGRMTVRPFDFTADMRWVTVSVGTEAGTPLVRIITTAARR
jgi:general secretion pathway protein I